MYLQSSWSAPWCSLRCSRRVYSCKRRYPIFRRSQSYPSSSSLQHELRFEQPCTQDLRSCASQDTVQSEQRSLEKRGLIYSHRLIRQRDARGSPFSSLLSKSVYFLSSPQRTRDVRFIARPPHRTVRAAFPHTAPTSGV